MIFRIDNKRQLVSAFTLLLIPCLMVLTACDNDNNDPTDIKPSPNEIVLEKEMAFSGNLLAADLIKKKAGGFYALGSIDGKGILFSLDEKGDVIWTWQSGSPAMSVAETSDGGAVVLVTGKFIKLDGDGTLIHESATTTNNYAQIVQAHDGGFLVSSLYYEGYNYPTYYGNTTFKKIDENLVTQWQRTHPEKFRGIMRLTNDGYILPRWPAYLQKPDYSFSMIDNAGTIVNTFNLGNSDTENLFAISEARDGGFLLGGAFSWDYNHAYLIRTNAFGEKVWEKEYFGGKDDTIIDVLELNNGDIVFLKIEATENLDKPYELSGWKLHTIRTNASGDITFQTESPTNISYMPNGAKVIKTTKGYCVFTASEGKFIITEFAD